MELTSPSKCQKNQSRKNLRGMRASLEEEVTREWSRRETWRVVPTVLGLRWCVCSRFPRKSRTSVLGCCSNSSLSWFYDNIFILLDVQLIFHITEVMLVIWCYNNNWWSGIARWTNVLGRRLSCCTNNLIDLLMIITLLHRRRIVCCWSSGTISNRW